MSGEFINFRIVFFVFQIPIEVSIHSEVLEQVLNFWNLLQRIPTINLRYPQPDFY